MYCVQNRNYCVVYNKSYIVFNYPSYIKSQGHNINVLKDHCTKYTEKEIHSIKKYMKTELVNNIANEAIYQLQYYKSFYLAQKKTIEIFLILFSRKIICLIAIDF